MKTIRVKTIGSEIVVNDGAVRYAEAGIVVTELDGDHRTLFFPFTNLEWASTNSNEQRTEGFADFVVPAFPGVGPHGVGPPDF